jgi:hypothetical protein
VACVIPFSDERDAVELANDTIYGLSGSIWTRDGGKMGDHVATVICSRAPCRSSSTPRCASTPFGFKQSGVGRELGPDASSTTPTSRTSSTRPRRSDARRLGEGMRDHRGRQWIGPRRRACSRRRRGSWAWTSIRARRAAGASGGRHR